MKRVRREYNLKKYDQFITAVDVAPFDHSAARIYGGIRADLASKGQLIGWNDLMIAATALSHNGVLITHNTREFSRIHGLMLEDWVIE